MRWQLEGEEQPGGGEATRVVNAEYLSAMEYRYDSGRRRYMTRRCDVTMAPLTAEAAWHDYLGDTIHADHAVDYDPGQGPAVVTEKAAHVPGVARYDHSLPAGDRVRQLFGNLIGTTEAECDDEGSVTGRTVYTAFGEVVPPPGSGGGPVGVASRYGYAGAWGYQSARSDLCGADGEEFACDPLAELSWLHVGERYYDPAGGRFVQRDPIGIRGGANVYVYVNNSPVTGIDPQGLAFWDGSNGFHEWVARSIWMSVHDTDTLANMSNARANFEAIGGSVVIGAGGYLGGTLIASGGRVSMLCATTYRGGIHFIAGGSGAGWIHFLGPWSTSTTRSGIPVFALPMRYPEALDRVSDASNCLTGALRAMIAAW